jgi:hypothetical protein
MELCDAGASGDEAAAAHCLREWQFVLIPDYQKKTDRVRKIMWEALPNVDESGQPFSGSYWSETDYYERDFSVSYW